MPWKPEVPGSGGGGGDGLNEAQVKALIATSLKSVPNPSDPPQPGEAVNVETLEAEIDTANAYTDTNFGVSTVYADTVSSAAEQRAVETANDYTDAQIASIISRVTALEDAVQAQNNAIANATQIAQDTRDALAAHITSDNANWQGVGDRFAQEEAKMYVIAKEVYDGTTPDMDRTQGVKVMGNGGLITLDGGSSYTVTKNGYLEATYYALVGVAPTITINDTAWDYAALSVLGIQSVSSTQVSTGDVVKASGSLGIAASLTVMFYPNASV